VRLDEFHFRKSLEYRDSTVVPEYQLDATGVTCKLRSVEYSAEFFFCPPNKLKPGVCTGILYRHLIQILVFEEFNMYTSYRF
jgi:hypothetical protein